MSYGLVYPIFAASIFHQDPIFLSLAPTALRGFWLGVLLAASPLAQFLSAPAIGALSDKTGRKPILQISSLLIIFGYLLSGLGVWKQSLFFLILGRVVTGVGAGNIAVINSSMADMSSPSAKARNFAWITMSNGLGFAVGPWVGGKLSVGGFDVPFMFAAILTAINFFLITFLFSETHHKKQVQTSLGSQLNLLTSSAVFRKFRLLFSAFFIFCFGWSFYWEFIPVTWIKDYGLNVSQIGDFYAYGSVFYVLSSGLLIRPFLKKFTGIPLLSIALAALGFFLLPLLHAKMGLYWIFIPVQQFLIALIFPIGTALVSNQTSASEQGKALGAFQALQSFAFASTPFLGGALLDLSYNVPLILSGSAMFLSCLVLLIGYRKKLF